jgi:hypothetical protein
VSESRYDWTGFVLHATFGACLGAVLGLGLHLSGPTTPLWLPGFLTTRSTLEDVIGSAVLLGLLGGVLRNRLWFGWLRWRRWSRD